MLAPKDLAYAVADGLGRACKPQFNRDELSHNRRNKLNWSHVVISARVPAISVELTCSRVVPKQTTRLLYA